MRAHFVMTQGLWASLRGMPFVVQLHRNASCRRAGQGSCDAYSSEGAGAGWEEYFEPIGGTPAAQVHSRRTHTCLQL